MAVLVHDIMYENGHSDGQKFFFLKKKVLAVLVHHRGVPVRHVFAFEYEFLVVPTTLALAFKFLYGCLHSIVVGSGRHV